MKLLPSTLFCALTVAAAAALQAEAPTPRIVGDYLEVRSCDVYTGSCVANAEMGLSGREGMLVWAIREGSWNGVSLAGLNVIAIVQSDGTLGDLNCHPRTGRAVLVVDASATCAQQDALRQFARHQAGRLLSEIVEVKAAEVDVQLAACAGGTCARVKAGDFLEISTRCLGGKDHLCGNEENFYPPLTPVQHPVAAYTELAAFRGSELNVTWEMTNKRSTYLGAFAL